MAGGKHSVKVKKRKPSMKRIVLRGVRFKLGVSEVTGTIKAQDGIPFFYCEERNTVSSLPFTISPDYLGATVSAYMRSASHELLLELGPDDVLDKDMKPYDIDLCTQLDRVEALYEEEKIRRLSDIGYPFVMSVLAGLVLVVSLLFHAWYIAIAAALVLLVELRDVRRVSRLLNRQIVYDPTGKWVNLLTRETNLNGGYKLPTEEEVQFF